ncbi:O-acetylserine/cysteine efflux transporter [Azospirillum agricola]|uniref:DMT family transporter n=1 Tax=Azospirillum agricola TaxID=1720247 RepID=UPI001AE1BD9D|nr:EamA family transporter [Azospirillum agricola]MBP2231193.1 O-acetylserine/cysteine efflux transporter [Azospirillum agricola]
MSVQDIGLALVVVLLWGVNFVAAKLALAEFSPLLLMGLRFTLVAALLLPFVRVPWGRLRGILLLSMVLGSVHFPLMFMGIKGLDAATASVAAQLQVPFSSLMAAIFFKDRLGWRRTLGMVIAFAGVALLAGEPERIENPVPLLLVVTASLAFALGSVQIKRLESVEGFTLNAWMALFAAPQLLTLSLLVERDQIAAIRNATLVGWGALAFIAVMATIVAYGLWYRLLRLYDVNQTVPYLLLLPAVGVASGVLLLGEPLSWRLVVGGLVTVAGLSLIVLRRPRVINDKVTNLT